MCTFSDALVFAAMIATIVVLFALIFKRHESPTNFYLLGIFVSIVYIYVYINTHIYKLMSVKPGKIRFACIGIDIFITGYYSYTSPFLPLHWQTRDTSFQIAATVIWVIFVVKNFQKLVLYNKFSYSTSASVYEIFTYEYLAIATRT